MRLFFAVNFTDEVKDALQRAIDGAGITDPPWRWVARDNFHITLKFLGETPDDRVGPLSECVASACRQLKAFDIRLGDLGGFPNLKKPRVLFYKLDRGVDPLRDLAERVDAALFDRFSIPKETRAFKAHATVARVKARIPDAIAAALAAAPAPDGAFQGVDALHLMQSELGRKGATYHRLKEIALA
jgi:2'-5' RNA ligase